MGSVMENGIYAKTGAMDGVFVTISPIYTHEPPPIHGSERRGVALLRFFFGICIEERIDAHEQRPLESKEAFSIAFLTSRTGEVHN